jgi:beta-N-acetylhexosaminidase
VPVPFRLVLSALLVAVLGFAVVAVVGGRGGSGGGDPSRATATRPSLTPGVSPSALADVLGSASDGADRASPGPSASAAGATDRSAPSGGKPAAATSCALARVGAMSIEQQAGQVMMIGVPVTNPRSAIPLVRQSQLGGVFLAGRSTQSASGLREDLRAVQDAARHDVGIGVHIGVDQEGGQVQTLRGPGFEAIPSAVQQGRWDPATLRARTAAWASTLAGAGLTLDLAPIADTVAPGAARTNPPIGGYGRNFDTTPGAVARDIGVVVPAMQNSGLLATSKHFPGLGRVHQNTDTSAAAVDDVATTADPNLEPFRTGVSAGTAAVMVSLARYPALDPTVPAVFSSRIVTGMLRDQLGFRGVVVSDDLGAAVAVRSVPVGERAVRFVAAGGDLVLSVRGADAAPMTAALAAEAHRSPAFARRLTDAATTVLASKVRQGLLDCPAATPASGPTPAPAKAPAR